MSLPNAGGAPRAHALHRDAPIGPSVYAALMSKRSLLQRFAHPFGSLSKSERVRKWADRALGGALVGAGAALMGAGVTIQSALWSIVGAVITVIGLAMLVAAIMVGAVPEPVTPPQSSPAGPEPAMKLLVEDAHRADGDLGALMDGHGTGEAGPSGSASRSDGRSLC